jgi:hypothetical protein
MGMTNVQANRLCYRRKRAMAMPMMDNTTVQDGPLTKLMQRISVIGVQYDQ